MWRSIITGTGSYIPTEVKTNQDFTTHKFYSEDSAPINSPIEVVVEKFRKITGIAERRYVAADLTTSDIATIAAEKAIQNSAIDPETLDYIIVAHNFGDIIKGTSQSDAVPALASRVKHNLKILNPTCVAYDILFGCPGWIQGMIHADAFFKAGLAKKALVIGAETLSRVIDNFDRDSMIFSDGAGATVIEYKEVPESGSGMLASCALSHSAQEAYFINMDKSYSPDGDSVVRYIKMKGRKVYEYALKQVPEAMKSCLEKAGMDITDLKKAFIHQANEKMDEAMLQALYKLYNLPQAPENIMPMSIHYLGNSSVATVPTLYDLVRRGKDDQHNLHPGDVILFASVGAGMNINAICYRV